MAAKEAIQARHRFESGSVMYAEVLKAMRTTDLMLDPATAEAVLREYATRQGIDFDGLVAGAAAHFNSPVITRRTKPLSGEELEFLFEDDQRSLDRQT